MLAPMRISLIQEEDRTLSELRGANCVPQRTRECAHRLRLNAQGWTVPAILEYYQGDILAQVEFASQIFDVGT